MRGILTLLLAGTAVAQPPASQPDRTAQLEAAKVLGQLMEARRAGSALTSINVGKRREAVKVLATARDPGSFDALLGMLDDKDVRGHAAQALGQRGDRRAFAPIAELYDGERTDPFVQDLAPRALLALDAGRAMPILLERFGKDERARFALERVFTERPEPAMRAAMHELLEHGDLFCRFSAIRVLARIGDGESVDRLLHLWERDPDTRGSIATAFLTLRSRKVANFLADALPNVAQPSLRRVIAEVLGVCGEPRVARRLGEALPAERDALARVRLLEAIGRLGDRRAIASLAPFLDDPATTAQPANANVVRDFPENVRVSAVAAWAILCLRDGRAPAPIDSLAAHPIATSKTFEAEVAAARAWWAEHRDEPGFGWTK